MTITSVMKERRTIRTFTGNIPDKDLLALLGSASYAPNHRMREPWSFILVNSIGDWEKLYTLTTKRPPYLAQLAKQLENDGTYPTGIIVICPVNADPKVAREDLLATAAFIQNFQLAAWADKYGVVWRTTCIDADFEQSIGIKANEIVVGFLQAGTFVNTAQSLPYRSNIEEKIKRLSEV
ncbi:nitroreductase [Erysipelotrichaceae bacterium]|nr:nitroreductase [Erysipelotrichaceae bacterium]